MEQTLLNEVNNDNFQVRLKTIENFCFGADIMVNDLTWQLPMLYDVISETGNYMDDWADRKNTIIIMM